MVSDVTECVVSSTIRSYVEVGIFSYMSVELPFLEGALV